MIVVERGHAIYDTCRRGLGEIGVSLPANFDVVTIFDQVWP